MDQNRPVHFRLETRSLGLRHVVLILIGMVGAAGLLLAALHGIEAAIWAAAYLWLGALDSPIDAMGLFRRLDDDARCLGADAATTLAADGALEAADGMLLFGISTAYVFAMMQAYWPMLMIHRH
jgi:hypothetical protein